MAESTQKSEDKSESEQDKSFELIVVPWMDAAQFKKVHEHLFSTKVTERRLALDQIAVWETRCHPALPPYIEASYGLTSAIVQDIIWTSAASLNQQIDIQYIYSSAITRFVNLLAEMYDTPGTISNLAKITGIPSFIIDLRNEASHAMRPSLPFLRLAAETALNFLKMKCWDEEYARVQNYIHYPTDVTDCKNVLLHYTEFQFPLLTTGVILRKERIKLLRGKYVCPSLKSLISSLWKITREIECFIKKDKKSFIKALISEGTFIPNDEDFKSFVTDEFFEFAHEEDLTAYTAYNTQPSYSRLKLPEILEELWYDIIVLLSKYDAVPMFLESLLKTQESRTRIGQKLIVSWTVTILGSHTGHYMGKTLYRRLFRKKGIVVDWNSMFYAALCNPCKYTIHIIPMIIMHVDHLKSIQRALELMLVRFGYVDDAECSLPKFQIFTVEDMRKMKMKQEFQRDKKKGDSTNNIWKLVSGDEYKKWPIGQIINPIKEPEELEMDDTDKFIMKDDFEEKYIRFNNENDKDVSMDNDSSDLEVLHILEDPHVLNEKVLQETTEIIKQMQSFLYKK